MGLNNTGEVTGNNFDAVGYIPSADGKCQLGRQLASGEYFTAYSSSVFSGSAPLTISIWFRPSSFSYSVETAIITKLWEYQLLLTTDQKTAFRISTAGYEWDVEVVDSSVVYMEEWNHALVYINPGVEIGLIVNGGAKHVASLSGGVYGESPVHIGGNVFLGSSEGGSDVMAGFAGIVDEIAFFNETLDDSQCSLIYNSGEGLFYRDGWGACPGSFAARSRAMGISRAQGVTLPLRQFSTWLSAGGQDAQVVCQYVWGARSGHRDELILRDSISGGSESSGEFGNERLWCLMDYYDPASIVDNSGAVVERYRFSAFGLRSILAPDFSPRTTSDYDWDFAFKGQFLDRDTGYYNYGYRYYSPELGRWLSRDPIGETGGNNLYAATKNNPINSVDYLGLVSCMVSSFSFEVRNWKLEDNWFCRMTIKLNVNFSLEVNDKSQCVIAQDLRGTGPGYGLPTSTTWSPDGGDWWDGTSWSAGGDADWRSSSFGDVAKFDDSPGFTRWPISSFPMKIEGLSGENSYYMFRTRIYDKNTRILEREIQWGFRVHCDKGVKSYKECKYAFIF